MTSTFRIALFAAAFVVILSTSAFIYPAVTRPNVSLIVSVDAELNGVADEYNKEYRPIQTDDQNIMTEVFALRIANLGKVDVNNVVINLNFEPKNNWYSLVLIEQSFGPPASISDTQVIIERLSVDETVTIKYEVSMNASAIGSNNLLQRKSQIDFIVMAEENLMVSDNLFNVRLPPS